MAQDEPEDAAAEAFEALRAEVTQLRAGVEGLSAAIHGQASVDYAPTLGAIAKSLTAIETHPALQIAPETFAYRLREATELSTQQGRRELGNAVQRVVTAGADLERLATGWRTGREQVRQIAIMTAVGAVAGIIVWVCFSGPIARALPAGWYVPERMAAATLRLDRWPAGVRLMQSADPYESARVAQALNLERDNRAVLDECREAARKANRAQRCTLSLESTPEQPN
ncbi:DUF6118 family protein [uncultured Phenylobacterium sp.]|uniref:DUF6118 family protein n=1 Tax=uncultured Phenylobacterium sp. TaxID=349273 RepID=UPI0025D3C20D|nr:DUF6118 family protein [uncultured Phenylobacterium sp.]